MPDGRNTGGFISCVGGKARLLTKWGEKNERKTESKEGKSKELRTLNRKKSK